MATRKKSNFKGKTTRNATTQKNASASYGYLNLPKGVNIFNPDPGSKITLDLLPYLVTDPHHPDRDEEYEIAIEGSQWYKRPFKMHRNVGVDDDRVVCPTSFGKKCPICEYMKKQIAEGADKEDTKPLRPKRRNLYIVVPLGSRKHDEEVHIWDMSQHLFQTLLNDELEEDERYGVFPELENGLSLKIRFDTSTVGSSKEFAEASRIDFIERDQQYEEDMIDELPNLDEVLVVLSYKELEKKFFEMDDDENPDDEFTEDTADESVAEKSSGIRRKGKTTKKGEEKEEEKEDDPKEDSPKRTRSRTTNSKATGDGECPYGYTFGKSCETEAECDDCPVWSDCFKAKEANE